jgi:hypothetical protein
MTSPVTNYGELKSALNKSLICLDDFVPSYTDFEQFANVGVAYAGQHVLTYNPQDFGEEYFQYLTRSGLAPKSITFLSDEQAHPSARFQPGKKREVLKVCADNKLEHLLSFMTSPTSIKLAEKLGLDIYDDNDLVEKLNNKICIKDVADSEGVRILENYVASTPEHAYDFFEKLHKGGSPVIFKSGYACGGQGNFIISTKREFDQFLAKTFSKKSPFVVEPLIYVKQNPCSLYYISPNKDVCLLGINDQIIARRSACIGSIFPGKIPEKSIGELLDASNKLAQRIAQEGYSGLLGFDFVIGHQGNVYFLETNMRFNYTHVLLHMLDHTQQNVGLLSDFVPAKKPKNMSEVLSGIDKEDLLTLDSPGIFPFYPFSKRKGRLNQFGIMILGDTKDKLLNLRKKYAARFNVRLE